MMESLEGRVESRRSTIAESSNPKHVTGVYGILFKNASYTPRNAVSAICRIIQLPG